MLLENGSSIQLQQVAVPGSADSLYYCGISTETSETLHAFAASPQPFAPVTTLAVQSFPLLHALGVAATVGPPKQRDYRT